MRAVELVLFSFLFLVLVLSASGLAAQELMHHGYGPGEVGDIVPLRSPNIRLSTWGDFFIISGNSLYEGLESDGTNRLGWFNCRKIADIPRDVYGIADPHTLTHVYTIWTSGEPILYDWQSHTFPPPVPSGFLDPFLAFPIVSATASQRHGGCYVSQSDTANYSAVNNADADSLTPTLHYAPSPVRINRRQTGQVLNGIPIENIIRCLELTDIAPYHLPSISDFNIDQASRDMFVARIDAECEQWKAWQDERKQRGGIELELPATYFTVNYASRSELLDVLEKLDTIGGPLLLGSLTT